MNAILENLVAPMVRRVGTAGAVWLMAKGLPSEFVEPFVNYLVGALLLVLDLLLARVYRKSVVTNVLRSVGLWPYAAAPFGGFGLRSITTREQLERAKKTLDQLREGD